MRILRRRHRDDHPTHSDAPGLGSEISRLEYSVSVDMPTGETDPRIQILKKVLTFLQKLPYNEDITLI